MQSDVLKTEQRSNSQNEASAKRYAVLDGWRGIAASMLAVFHLQVASHIYFLPLIRNSYLFVDFFFLLSGFVISHAYSNKIKSKSDIITFMIKRFGRLYPLHIFMLAVFVVTELLIKLISYKLGDILPRPPFSGSRSLEYIPINVLMLNGVGMTSGATWNGPSWSISAEFFVYGLFALFAILAKKIQLNLVYIAITISFFVLLLWSPGFEVCNRFSFVRCVFSFFSGHLVWRLKDKTLPMVGHISETISLSLVILFTWVASGGMIQLISPVIFGITVFVFSKESGYISKFMKNGFVQLLGRASYSIYMVHYYIAFMTFNLLKVSGKLLHKSFSATYRNVNEILNSNNLIYSDRLDGSHLDLVYISSPFLMDVITIIFLALVVGIGIVSFHVIEKPGIAFFKRASFNFSVSKGGGDN